MPRLADRGHRDRATAVETGAGGYAPLGGCPPGTFSGGPSVRHPTHWLQGLDTDFRLCPETRTGGRPTDRRKGQDRLCPDGLGSI